MKRNLVACFLAGFFLLSCASGPSGGQGDSAGKWGYEKDAVVLHISADKKLNFKDKKAHALVLCVYQLMSPNAFNQLSDSREGVYKLLECSVFDPASVAVSKQIVVNPGKDMDVKLDRAEGARYVAVVAGYFATMDKDKICRMYKVPEVAKSMFNRSTRPDKLEVKLVLGPTRIQNTPEGK